MAAPKSSTEDLSLTHAEAMALMTAYRFGPLTTYRLRRLYGDLYGRQPHGFQFPQTPYARASGRISGRL